MRGVSVTGTPFLLREVLYEQRRVNNLQALWYHILHGGRGPLPS